LETDSDFRSSEYWQKTNGRWEKTKIMQIGIAVPDDAILPNALTDAQRSEIAA
jgi:hypothetical protein